MDIHRAIVTFLAVVFAGLWNTSAFAQAFNDFELEPHNYYERTAEDGMSRLIASWREGKHDFGSETGLVALQKLLTDLDVPVSSQVIVFSKTSLQRDLVSPENPRAMYFNEDIHVAWMPGGKIEVNSFDAGTGGMFYFEVQPKNPGDRVGFEQPRSCFGCHGGSATNFLPGPLARSNFTDATGRRLRGVRSHNRIGHSIPFAERWGGYFVTNAPPTLEHMGNSFAVRAGREISIPESGKRSTTDLSEFFDVEKLLRPDSNILPLMLFDHQIELHNLLVEALYRHRTEEYNAEQNGGVPRKDLAKKTDSHFDKLVRYFLFADEPSLAGHEFDPAPDFVSDFHRNQRTDSAGQSLKDLDLKTRIFKNRCSYMIYSRSFEEAPQSMKDRVYDRLWDILSPEEAPDEYAYLDSDERRRILDILKATKSDLPESWKAAE